MNESIVCFDAFCDRKGSCKRFIEVQRASQLGNLQYLKKSPRSLKDNSCNAYLPLGFEELFKW